MWSPRIMRRAATLYIYGWCGLFLISAGTAEEAVCSQGEETGEEEGKGAFVTSHCCQCVECTIKHSTDPLQLYIHTSLPFNSLQMFHSSPPLPPSLGTNSQRAVPPLAPPPPPPPLWSWLTQPTSLALTIRSFPNSLGKTCRRWRT